MKKENLLLYLMLLAVLSSCMKGKGDTSLPSEFMNRDEIATYVDSEIKKIKSMQIRESGKNYSIIKTYAESQPDGAILSLIYGDPFRSDKQKTLLFFLDNTAFNSPKLEPVIAALFQGDFYSFESEDQQNENLIAQGPIAFNIVDPDNYIFTLNGNLESMQEEVSVSLETTQMEVLTLTGMGNASISVSDAEATIEGELGVLSYSLLKDLQRSHPEVTTLVLKDVSGAVHNMVNLYTGYMIRDAGYKTKLYANSIIASGGVDLFLAGIERIVQSGAKIGLHSWVYQGNSAHNLPKSHPAHQPYIDYYTAMYGDRGVDLYYFIINAADYDSIYWMTEMDIKKWGIATTYID